MTIKIWLSWLASTIKKPLGETNKGSSLIEMLVTVAIVGTLSTMAVNFNTQQDVMMANKKIDQIEEAIIAQREIARTSLRYITGSACSACTCGSNGFSSDACGNQMERVMESLGLDKETAQLPWGGYISIDENEDETWGGSSCRRDAIVYHDSNGIRHRIYLSRLREC